MSFGSPLFLLGLLALPLLVAAYVAHERQVARSRDAFAPAPVRASLVPSSPGWRRHAPAAGYALALAALVVALAKPQTTRAVDVEQATVVLVTDRSGSMAATDVAPSRLVAARRAADSFVDAVPGKVRLGAVAFNHAAQIIASPTRDHEEVRAAIHAIAPAGSTATGDALDLGLRMVTTTAKPGMKRPPAAIVLLSDGKSVRGANPLEVARRAKTAKVPIYTVALGTPGGTITVPRPGGGTRQEPVPPDPATLRQVAQISGGTAHTAADAGKLEAVFEQLGSQVTKERRKQEVTAGFAGGALVLLLIAAAASLRWFGRLV